MILAFLTVKPSGHRVRDTPFSLRIKFLNLNLEVLLDEFVDAVSKGKIIIVSDHVMPFTIAYVFFNNICQESFSR